MKYQQLTEQEILKLESQGCSAENWGDVLITSKTALNNIRHVHFSGKNKIGEISGENRSYGNVIRPNGISYAHLHNCKIGDRPFIKNIKNYIANYVVGDDVVIENIDIMATEGESCFGNGVIVECINEGGGRAFPIFDYLSAQMAYILSMYRHRTQMIEYLTSMISAHAHSIKSDQGTVGDHVVICNVRKLKNVCIGEYARIDGASSLENGSINSYKEAPIYIGNEVMAKDFIISSDSLVDNATLISKCFVGQGCVLDKHYSAENSVFFANSQGFNGEASAIFAGPFTVTHHKSTLLIAGMFSFMNAGSGSNQSNHMYKLGPIHQGILERGAKTTSNSYLLWPAKVGAFTLVMGRHYHNTDSSDLPFSYLIENNDESVLAPGVNLRSVGTVRDAQKWPKRDRRHENYRNDCINFNLLSPFTINKMYEGLQILKELERVSGHNVDEYTYQGLKIRRPALLRGMELYRVGIYKFLGNSLISRIYQKEINSTKDLQKVLKPDEPLGKGKWVDVGGLICPLEVLDQLLDDIENDKIPCLNSLQEYFANIHSKYYEMEWTWVADLFEKLEGRKVESLTPEDFIKLVEYWKESVVGLDKTLYDDAKKEFSLSTQVGFGVDGDEEERRLDFESVRGDFDTNSNVQEILEHIKRKTHLGNRVIDQMKELIEKESK
ncbi:uncharacterized protein DUF4954 [Balneicella halophila]|uniref:Uncharacterized protein DUF4954 n=1 Tax=Balneicella halophila TaxID=1537566 RepID=A0A7L4UNI6_BALHA|nr:DUF4954 family protein [Balneicella halophila]PVX50740.1 uncharacterized protein DUF4954 [Balneicella halophila]